MYLEHFGLKEFPFRLTPDTDFLYLSEGHARAKAYMEYTVWNHEGFVVITGEVGCGKTTLVQKMLSELDENVLVAKIFQTQLDQTEFLQAVLVEFGLNPFNAKKVELMDMLNTFLIDNFLKLRQLVLVVDDAHNLSPSVLEEIRMLSSLETNKEKLLHIILVGQPELNAVLEDPGMEQLLQRVRLRYHLRPLTEEEIRGYIAHRLTVAGAADSMRFPPETIETIYKYTGGVPRLINTLCDTTLTCAYADQLKTLSEAVVNTAIGELQWQPYAKRTSRRRTRAAEPTGDVAAALTEQTRALSAIAARLGKLEATAPALGSIQSLLTAIEAHLRRMASQDKGAEKEHKERGTEPPARHRNIG